MRTRMPLWLVALLVVALAAVGCGARRPSATPTPVGPTATPTALPPTATPTAPPLTSEEQDYFDAVYKLREKYDRGLLSWSLMETTLKALKPPLPLADTHAAMLSTLADNSFAAEMFSLSLQIYALSYCSFGSWDYSSCIQRQDNALADAKRYGAQIDAARARFRTLWAEALNSGDNYRVAHGAGPVPTVTPFPRPPVTTPAPRGTATTGVFDTEITVTGVNMDAWSAIKAASSSNKAPATGDKYIMVAVRVVNRAPEKVWLHESQFSLYADGTTYEESGQTDPSDFDAKELGPGESTSGNLSFAVPTGVSDAVLLFLDGDLVMALK